MLMKVESEELRNCRRLLDYVDGGFQSRIKRGDVDFDSYEGEDCGTPQCLLGWFEIDVLGHMNDDAGGDKYWGFTDMDQWRLVFGSQRLAGGDIHARRAALVKHIEHLEQQEKVAA